MVKGSNLTYIEKSYLYKKCIAKGMPHEIAYKEVGNTLSRLERIRSKSKHINCKKEVHVNGK